MLDSQQRKVLIGSSLLGKGDTNHLKHGRKWYVSGIKHRIHTIICHVLITLCHCFLATLYLSKLSLVDCPALIQVPASSFIRYMVPGEPLM